MARKFNKPLTKDDLAWLGSRRPKSYVDRMIAVYGVEGGEDTTPEEPENSPETGEDTTPEEPENSPETGEGTEGEGQAPEASEEAGEPAEDAEDEDLIGDDQDFDPKDHTEAEIVKHLEDFEGDADAEKVRILALEADGRQRKGVLAL
jgi:hypothetical protein